MLILCLFLFFVVTQSNMEWKPKLSKKTNTISSQVIDSTTSPSAALDELSSGLKVQVTSLSDNLSQVSVNANKHVVIPQHLRVPEEDKFNLTFGSFEDGINSPKDFMSEAPIRFFILFIFLILVIDVYA